jgi:integrase/recombinase XerD
VSHLGASGHGDLSALSAVQVSEFVLANCQEPNAGSTTILVVGLRALLRYLHLAGITLTELAGAAARWPATTLPSPISHDDAKRLLPACDRRTTVGRRDFAVLTLMLRLGLRVSEVAVLELGDVDWRHGEILVRGKGRRQERLPLPADVGGAVVFSTVLAPDGALTGKAVTGNTLWEQFPASVLGTPRLHGPFPPANAQK